MLDLTVTKRFGRSFKNILNRGIISNTYTFAEDEIAALSHGHVECSVKIEPYCSNAAQLSQILQNCKNVTVSVDVTPGFNKYMIEEITAVMSVLDRFSSNISWLRFGPGSLFVENLDLFCKIVRNGAMKTLILDKATAMLHCDENNNVIAEEFDSSVPERDDIVSALCANNIIEVLMLLECNMLVSHIRDIINAHVFEERNEVSPLRSLHVVRHPTLKGNTEYHLMIERVLNRDNTNECSLNTVTVDGCEILCNR